MFKLWRYAEEEADAPYTSDLDTLPDRHLLYVLLHNNRALARTRFGYHDGEVETCAAVLQIVGVGYHPAGEAKVESEECGAGVGLAHVSTYSLTPDRACASIFVSHPGNPPPATAQVYF